MRGRGLAAFFAGFGTGYLNAEEKKKERERQERLDKEAKELRDRQNQMLDRQMRREDKADARDDALQAGMAKADNMKVGQLAEGGEAVDVSQAGFQSRLEQRGVAPDVVAQAAPIYAQRAGQKGAEGWLSNSFEQKDAEGNVIDPGIGVVKPTKQSDIVRQRGVALRDGGKYDQSIAMMDKADALDIKELQNKITGATSIEEIDKIYDMFPDNRNYKGEFGTLPDGSKRYFVWSQDADGNRAYLDNKGYADFNDFKKWAALQVGENPEAVLKYYDESRALERQGVQDARAGEKHGLDMEAGRLGVQGARSDLIVKQGTEGARIEAAGLTNKATQANIAQSYDAIRHNKVVEGQKSQEAKDKTAEERRKNGDQFRQDLNAATGAFDKSFKRDAMGNLIGSELDSKLYAQAVQVIGSEIKGGSDVGDAQAIGRRVYDMARKDGVSVADAYKKLKGTGASSQRNPEFDAMMTK
jgi:hypothetical protein